MFILKENPGISETTLKKVVERWLSVSAHKKRTKGTSFWEVTVQKVQQGYSDTPYEEDPMEGQHHDQGTNVSMLCLDILYFWYPKVN